MIKIGLDIPQSGVAHTMDEAIEIAKDISKKLDKIVFVSHVNLIENGQFYLLDHSH